MGGGRLRGSFFRKEGFAHEPSQKEKGSKNRLFRWGEVRDFLEPPAEGEKRGDRKWPSNTEKKDVIPWCYATKGKKALTALKGSVFTEEENVRARNIQRTREFTASMGKKKKGGAG